MNPIIEIVHVAMGISGIAFNPMHGNVIIEFDMKMLCCFNQKQIRIAANDKTPLHPIIEKTGGNVVISDISEFLAWNIEPSSPMIIATRKGAVDFFSCQGTRITSIEFPQKAIIDKVFPNAVHSTLLCVYSVPVNVDFEETRAGMFSTGTKAMKISNLIHSEELAVQAVWNNEAQTAVITEGHTKKLYIWKKDGADAAPLALPKACEGKNIAYFFDESGTYCWIPVIDDSGILSAAYFTSIQSDKLLLNEPMPMKKAALETAAVCQTGAKIALLLQESGGKFISIIYSADGTEIAHIPVAEKYAGMGLGWLSDAELISAGSNDLMLIKFAQNALPRIKGGEKSRK